MLTWSCPKDPGPVRKSIKEGGCQGQPFLKHFNIAGLTPGSLGTLPYSEEIRALVHPEDRWAHSVHRAAQPQPEFMSICCL